MTLFVENQPESPVETKSSAGLPLRIPDGARILIVSNEDSDADRLKSMLQEAGFVSERAKTIARGCEVAKSGKFQVIVATPLLPDGSWKRLDDIALHYDLGFEILLWARDHDIDLVDRVQALNDRVFDILDPACGVSETLQTIHHALWVAYLKGAGPNPSVTPQRAA